MKEQPSNSGSNKGYHDLEDEFLRERMERWSGPHRAPFDPLLERRPSKSKWAVGLFALLIPGLGHFYLGQMQRGLALMMLLAADIVAIVFTAIKPSLNIPFIVLLSLLIPVIYFYNIFDALQQADKVNGHIGDGLYGETGASGGRFRPRGSTGFLLISAGILLFVVTNKPEWMNRLFELLGTSFGAIVLIGVGVYLFYKESRKS